MAAFMNFRDFNCMCREKHETLMSRTFPVIQIYDNSNVSEDEAAMSVYLRIRYFDIC